MAKSYSAQAEPGAFVETTTEFDIQRIKETNVNSEDFKELLVRLYETVNGVAVNLNLKDTGLYSQQEFVTGQQFFSNPALSSTTSQTPTQRQVYRKVVNFGALPNTGLTSVAHGLTITEGFIFTKIYATASDVVSLDYIPIPYSGANPIELNVDNTNVNITTTSDRSMFTVCYVVLEYLKQ